MENAAQSAAFSNSVPCPGTGYAAGFLKKPAMSGIRIPQIADAVTFPAMALPPSIPAKARRRTPQCTARLRPDMTGRKTGSR